MMQTARKYGIVFNAEKCIIGTKEVKFFGMIYSSESVKPDPGKTKEIADLPPPDAVRELQQFLEMNQFLGPFLRKLSHQTAVLRKLCSVESEWVWTTCHQRAFDTLKEQVCNTVNLCYFDKNLSTKVQVDSSLLGLGAALIQTTSDNQERVIAFASKSLTDTESRYANIEREMLAVVFGTERFHTFLYGSKCVVESDHKPLAAIHLKNISHAPARLQRRLLR